MSDTDIIAVGMKWRNVDVIDEAWIMDYLSDDDIEVPKDMRFNDDDDEEDEDEESPNEEKQAWKDLGLDRFVHDVQQQHQLQQQEQQQQQQRQQQPAGSTAQTPAG